MFHKTVLPNGVRVVTGEAAQYRSASVSLYFGVGSRHENAAEAGVSHFLEHMLFKGTESRPTARAVSETVEGVGGVLNAGTGREYTTYWAKLPSGHAFDALDLLADMVRHSVIAQEEVERERRVIQEEIKGQQDSPPRQARELLSRLLWPDHPLGREVAGTHETVEGITRDDLLTHLGAYTGGNLVVACGGDVRHGAAVEWADGALGDLPSGEGNPPAASRKPDEGAVGLVGKPVQQASFCLGVPALSYHDPRRYALTVLDSVLGGGMSSRLFLEVRERRGLAYSVGCSVQEYADDGAFVVSAGVAPEKLAQSLHAVWEQLDLLREEPVSEEDLARIKRYIKGRTVMSLEGSRGLLTWAGLQELLRGQIREPEEALALVDAVTAGDVQELARELFEQEQVRLSVCGPFEDDREIEIHWREAVESGQPR